MKTSHCLKVLWPALLCLLSFPARANDPNAATRRMLEETILPEIRFEQADLQDALRFLVQASRESDPNGIGLNFVYFAPKDGEPAPRKVTLELRNVPMADALAFVAEQSGTVYHLERGVVRVGSRQHQRTETRFYSVDSGQFRNFQERMQGR